LDGCEDSGYLKEKLSLEPSYRTAVRWLHELNFHLRVPQPWPERQNEEERKRFLKELRSLCADPTVELWFSDECGVEEDPRPRRRWVQPGKRRTVPYLGDHIRCSRSPEWRTLQFDRLRRPLQNEHLFKRWGCFQNQPRFSGSLAFANRFSGLKFALPRVDCLAFTGFAVPLFLPVF
jgi:hypothetical protein